MKISEHHYLSAFSSCLSKFGRLILQFNTSGAGDLGPMVRDVNVRLHSTVSFLLMTCCVGSKINLFNFDKNKFKDVLNFKKKMVKWLCSVFLVVKLGCLNCYSDYLSLLFVTMLPCFFMVYMWRKRVSSFSLSEWSFTIWLTSYKCVNILN